MAREIDEFVPERDGEIIDDLTSLTPPDTACGDYKRPLRYSTDDPPQEIPDINVKNLKVDNTINSDSNLLYESRAVAKNLTGISANTTLAEKSTLADSIGGISTYTNVGFFTSFIHPSTNGTFGNSLATNGNGNLIVVGNTGFRTDGYYVGVGSTVGLSTFYGAVYLFERTNSNNFVNRGYIVGQYSKVGYGATHGAGIGSTTQGYGYTLPDYNTPVTFAGDDYGHSVAMTADGKTFVVGGPNITGESTIGIATTTNSRVTIGSSVTIENPNVGVVWIYDYYSTGSCGSGGLSKIAKFEGQEDGDLFGQSVAISADGKIVVVGAPGAGINSEGYTYVYERTDNSYSQVGILTGPTSGSFGDSVSVTADGNTIVVGDSTGADAYVFDRDEDDVNEDNECGIFELVTTLSNTGGTKVCISDDGQTIITADTDSVVYDRLGDTFTVIGTITGGSSAITCSSDGKVITTASSSAYRVYNREGNTFYLNHTGLSTIDSFDMSSNTKTLYRGIISEDKVYCDDQVVETFVYSDVNGNIGIGTTNPTERLDVIGNGKFSGTVTAQEFIGDINITQLNIVGVSTLGVTSTTNLTSQQVNVSGIVTAATYVAAGTTAVYAGAVGVSTVDSNTTAFHYITYDTNLSGVNISNFGPGKKFEIIARQPTGNNRTIVIKTSTTTTGHVAVPMIVNSGGNITNGTFTLNSNGIHLTLFNMNGTIIGGY